ncbi:MAG: metallophosphoesterase [Pegethrix bostrychoides GSE-TBD4-15B]|jgi:hypothetical protein|uniref:Metallophosphoesterase n=1 Tax=Pegethrix bostrychoides GSE-TBD4-15B TaxID=2839662 RepID=A0A951PB63_9CYAN|nr:metallophosphoesterase [Pegethrix bostrychoides GSE-TBD4-15B]
MSKRFRLWGAGVMGLLLALILGWLWRSTAPQLLSDPFLQAPTPSSVQVVWFTEFAGRQHWVEYGDGLAQQVISTTTQLSRMREDQGSHWQNQTPDRPIYPQPVARPIWRHEAQVAGIGATRLPYRVVSQREDGRRVASNSFSLAALPPAGTPLKILLTSDHQLKPMVAANLQKVVETVGAVDAVLLAGDLVDVPDRASEWFDDSRGNAFFASLQGRAAYSLEIQGRKTQYRGGAIIQSAPLFPAVGNHEVMGRFSTTASLNEQFNDPVPRGAALQTRPANLRDASFNTDSYEEIFTLPASIGGKKYYAVTVGDLRLVSLFAANIWRTPGLADSDRGRYRERQADLNHPERWGYGQHIFEPITPESAQYRWLQAELASPEFRQAKYKVVMFHHPPHSLGDNVVPAYTDPVQQIERQPDGRISAVRYEYPLDSDYLVRDVMPLLEAAGVQLVFYGHSHLWNRFVSPGGMNFLESSNVGNTYGAFVNQQRAVPIGNREYYREYYREQYIASGDPNGLSPVLPTIRPSLESGQPQPYIASNQITVFSILETATGTVSSYRFDTAQPSTPPLKFDQFSLSQ